MYIVSMSMHSVFITAALLEKVLGGIKGNNGRIPQEPDEVSMLFSATLIVLYMNCISAF